MKSVIKSVKKKISLIVFFQIILSCYAVAKDQNIYKVVNKSIELYNNHQFDESLATLETIKNSRNSYTNWYYYYAINKTRLKEYDEALLQFKTYIQNTNARNTAKAYYYTGLIQFYQGEYEKALNSLELSLDISDDPKMDRMTEALIDKTIRYQNYYENNKRTNLLFLLGYNFDTNVLNLSQSSFGQNLNGHILGYGVALSHKWVDRYNFVFEPALAVLDNYTLDSQFKANSTLQSVDAFQVLLSAPLRFYFEKEKFTNKFDLTLNAYNVYLPVTTATRELALSSIYFKAQILTPFAADYALKYNTTIASDQAYGFTNEEDNASGVRVEFMVTLAKYLSQENNKNLFYDLGVNYSGTKGVNARNKKYFTAIGYIYPSFLNTVSALRLGYHYLNYSEKLAPRTDNQINFSYSISKSLHENSALSFSLGAVSNSSNVDLNKYSDVNLGLQYTFNIGIK